MNVPVVVGLLTFAIAFPAIFLGIFIPYVIRRAWNNRPSARHARRKH